MQYFKKDNVLYNLSVLKVLEELLVLVIFVNNYFT